MGPEPAATCLIPSDRSSTPVVAGESTFPGGPADSRLTWAPSSSPADSSLTRVPSPSPADSSLTRAPSEAPLTICADDPGSGQWQRDPSSPDDSRMRFRFVRHHARGGLGEVSVAHDLELRRDVALKEIRLTHADHPDSRMRFVQEAEITGQLEHPGVVPVYGLGRYADGRPYYAMRFIRGKSLKEVIEGFHAANPPWCPLELRQLLGRFVDVCNTIAYAHSRRIIHRDIKPDNVMLGEFGETLVVDWGLAKQLGQPDILPEDSGGPVAPGLSRNSFSTLPGAVMGTPQYMSPEQAAGSHDQLSPASDIYQRHYRRLETP
jgi:tRNA A-37 threonylcarbamoyl transferase component Bud32